MATEEFRVDSAAYQRAARALKEAGDKDLKREWSRAIREVAKPFAKEVLTEGARGLPSRGGLAARVAAGRIGVQASPMRATVSLKTKEGYDLGAMDEGELRHPVWARRNRERVWVRQVIPGRLFSKPFEDKADQVRQAIVEAGQSVLGRISEGS